MTALRATALLIAIMAASPAGAAELNIVAAGAVHLTTHAVERVRQIFNLGFLGGVLNDRHAVGESCRHHQIFG